MTRRTRVYVAGPITSSGNLLDNVHKAVMVGDGLLHAGYAPYVPHLNCLWEMISGARNYELWLALDMEFLSTCDALLRLNGVSKGADREMQRARELGIPVFMTTLELYGKVPPTQDVLLDACGTQGCVHGCYLAPNHTGACVTI